MKPISFSLCALLAVAAPLAAQTALHQSVLPGGHPDTLSASRPPDAPDASDDEGVPLGLQFGMATGALHYAEGRSEQSLGAVVRWAPVASFNLSTTPTAIRASIPAVAPSSRAVTQSGLVDLPVEATVAHAFHTRFAPTVSVGFGVTLPVGDSVSGFGTGRVGYSTSASFGFAPTDRVWVHLGAGRSLSGLSVQSAFTGANGWGDGSAGYSLSDRVSASGGYSTDLGAVDPAIGRSTSVNGGLALALRGPLTLNVTTSHGMHGAAPRWGMVMGIGTAFPYLRHLDSGAPGDLLHNAFGGGTHGLGGSGGGSSSSGRGRHP